MWQIHIIRNFGATMLGDGCHHGWTGETADWCYNSVRDSVHIHDLNVTVLHCLGLEHTRLTYCFQGRDFRLTDVHREVVNGILG